MAGYGKGICKTKGETVEILTAKLTGVAPLLMHNERLANPLDSIARQMKAITNKSKKTDTDIELHQHLEWSGGMYATEEVTFLDGKISCSGRPAIKGTMIESMLVKAAKANKLGEAFKAGVFVEEDMIPLEYEGSKDVAKLVGLPKFRDVRGSKVGMARVMRTRPRFNEWSLTVGISYFPDVVSKSGLLESIKRAGMFVGLADYRPKFGRFNVEILKD